jgi:hypothetical protein
MLMKHEYSSRRNNRSYALLGATGFLPNELGSSQPGVGDGFFGRRSSDTIMCIIALVIGALVVMNQRTIIAASVNEDTLNSDPEAVASMYVADFVSTAAFGVAMNDAGDVVGSSYPDPGCGSFCLPVLETVAWRRGNRIVLPTVPGFSGITVTGINNKGWISGYAGLLGTTTHAVVWQPSGSTYTAIDLGTLPGTMTSTATGIASQQRVVGWSATLNFPPTGSPFLWTPSGGMVDLSTQGFPDESPAAISPGGTVATAGFWYQLGNPGSIQTVPPPPSGFSPPGSSATAINDAGDQLRFLASTGAENLVYPFRLPHQGTWRQISFSGTGHLTTYGAGSINPALDITATVQSTGMIAAGPTEQLQPIAPLLSPAYPGAVVTFGGPMNASGQILAQVIIGQSKRLMRLTPAMPCADNCIKVSQLTMRGEFVQDPNDPGHCSPTNQAHNRVQANLTVTDENGVPLGGVRIGGRFLDDYWTNRQVSGTTNAQGVVKFTNNGPCGVGAVVFLVDNATLGNRSFDRTTGILTDSVIPQ